MSFSSLRFGQFCNFRPKVCFSASRSKEFEIFSFSSGLVTTSIIEKWMELTSRRKMARFRTFWIQMRKNKPLDETKVAKLAKPQGRKWHFT
ncbi:hypothetical protein Hanom_Chr09g00829851 [Helianthus anomalus]